MDIWQKGQWQVKSNPFCDEPNPWGSWSASVWFWTLANAKYFFVQYTTILFPRGIPLYSRLCKANKTHPQIFHVLGARPSGYNGASGFNKSQSLQNLSRPRRGEPEKVPIEHLFEKERLIEQQTATIEVSLLQTPNWILFAFFDICCKNYTLEECSSTEIVGNAQTSYPKNIRWRTWICSAKN